MQVSVEKVKEVTSICGDIVSIGLSFKFGASEISQSEQDEDDKELMEWIQYENWMKEQIHAYQSAVKVDKIHSAMAANLTTTTTTTTSNSDQQTAAKQKLKQKQKQKQDHVENEKQDDAEKEDEVQNEIAEKALEEKIQKLKSSLLEYSAKSSIVSKLIERFLKKPV